MQAMMDCKEVLRQLWDYLDGELVADRQAEIAEHIRNCRQCFPTFQFEEQFLHAVQAAGVEPRGTGALRARVVAALREQGVTDPRFDDRPER